MSIQATPLNLFKANAELQLRIAQLMRESGHRWLEAVQQTSAAGLSETTAELHSLLQAEDWQSLARLPAETVMRRLEDHMINAKNASDIAIKNQQAFASGLQQALEAWQKSVADALRADGASNLPALPMQDIFKQWLSAWTPATQDPAQAKSGKAAQK